MPFPRDDPPPDEPCGYCGNEPAECVCHLAPDFPDDPIEELDTEYLDWGFYVETIEEENDEGSGQENPGTPGQGEGRI
jgi:hypothetical protein